MPTTIDDLKKDGKKISATISMGEPSYETEERVPDNTIIIGNAPSVKKKKEHRIVPSSPVPNASASISAITGEEAKKEVQMAMNRVKANFSDMPKSPDDNLGVDIKESPESEIFKKGGIFDQYVKEKVEEVGEWYKEKKEEAEQKVAEEAQKKEEAGEDSSTSTLEEDYDTTIVPATNGRVIDISRKDKKSDMKINVNNEVDTDEEVKDNFDLDEDLDEFEEESEPVEEKEKAEIHNAEEVISTEPIKKDIKEEEVPKKKIGDRIDRITRRVMAVDIDEDLDDEEENEVETQEEEDQVEILKSLISQKIIPVAKSLDISTFAVAKKPTSSNSIFETKEAAIAKWVLPATGITILLREISGANLETMRSLLSRRIPDMRGTLKIIYDHIVSPKPDNFDVWLKSIAFADYDHLFMAIYIAAFVESNFLPIDCAECKKPYLTEDMDIMDMVKFKDDESEKKFTNLYNSEASNPNGLYVTENVPISNKFAIAFREPSLYSVLIESQYFDDTFNRRYQQTIALMPYIDQVFFIDVENRRLVPIDFKLIANDPAKTARLKIKKLDAILNTLNVDENAVLATFTDKINNRADWFTYQIPESTCPNCEHVNPAAEDQTASSLVFLRNRLGALATI